MKWVYLNNDFVRSEKSFVHYRDLALQRAYGIFDFFRLVNHTPLHLDDHLTRFYFSAEQMRLPVPYSKDQLSAIIGELIRKNDTPNTGIRITLTGGISEDAYTISTPNFIISQHFFKPPTAEQLQAGLKLMLFAHQRQLPQVKTIDYIMPIWMQPLMKQSGADDLLYYQNEFATECPRNNFFIITQDEKIVTPAIDILKGITRDKLLHKAVQYFEVEERNVSLEDIRNAKEAFITSTTKGILPVASVDDIIFQERSITKKFQDLMANIPT